MAPVILFLGLLLSAAQAAPSISFVYPTAASVFKAYQRQVVSWTAIDVPAVTLYYQLTPMDSWNLLGAVQCVQGRNNYTWFLPSDTTEMASNSVALRMQDVMGLAADAFSPAFTILPGNIGIIVSSPSSHGTVTRGAVNSVTWNFIGSGNVHLSYAKGTDAPWTRITTAGAVDGALQSYPWTLRQYQSIQGDTWPTNVAYYLRCTLESDELVYDQVGPFSVSASNALSITDPTPGIILVDGVSHGLSWTTAGSVSTVSISITNGDSTVVSMSGLANSGQFLFQPHLPNNYVQPPSLQPLWQFNVTSADGLVSASSGFFFVSPPKTINVVGFTAPVQQQPVLFYNPVANVSVSWTGVIFLLDARVSVSDNSDDDIQISNVDASSGYNTHSIAMSIPLGDMTNKPITVRVFDHNDPSVFWESAATVSTRSLRLTTPISNLDFTQDLDTVWLLGEQRMITWSSYPMGMVIAHVDIWVDYYPSATAVQSSGVDPGTPLYQQFIATDLYNSGYYVWSLPNSYGFNSPTADVVAVINVVSHPDGATVAASTRFVVSDANFGAKDETGVIVGAVLGVLLAIVLVLLVAFRRRLAKRCATFHQVLCDSRCCVSMRGCCTRGSTPALRTKLKQSDHPEASVEL